MCLAIPAKVIALDEAAQTATVALDGVRKSVSTALLDRVAEGDYLLIHVGYALNTIQPEEAEKTLALMAEAGVIAAAPSDEDEGAAA